jgi:glutaminyl-peptide cyclotransferase
VRTSLALTLLGLSACAQAAQPAAEARDIPSYGFRVVQAYPHDPAAFTQGLFWLDGQLYESTGHVGRSTLRRVNLADGRVLQSADVPGVFGEGIVHWGSEILSLTWQNGVGYRWDRKTFRRLGSFPYRGEGWGLTQNGKDVIMSDGTAELRFLDPKTLKERRRLTVTANGAPVARLNELEWIKGEIFANVWLTNLIARIDPKSGQVTGWIDLSPLARQMQKDYDSVLNGIAYDAAADRLFVTGKNWPKLFEIDLVEPAGR